MGRKPKMPVSTTQLANPFGILSSYLGEVWSDSDIPLTSYKEMVEKDETVAASLEFLAYNTANKIGDYIHPNPEVQNFVRKNLERMETPLEALITKLVINALVYGFAVAEIVWEVVDDKYMVKRVVVVPSDTLHAKLNDYDIESFIQNTGFDKIEIPREKVIFVKMGEGVLGQSALRRAWRPYRFKSALFKFWAIAMERYSMPILFGQTTDVERLVEDLRNLWINGVIATDTSTDIKLLEPRVNIAGEFREAIEYANQLIARSLLVPPLLLSTERSGAYSLGRVQMNLFMSAVERLAKIVAEALLNDFISKIISYNFEGVDSYGAFLFRTQPSAEEMSRLALAFNQLVGAGVLDPVEDGNWIRAMIGAPRQQVLESAKQPETEQELAEFYDSLFGGGEDANET